jgi:hypothetical protein
MKWRGNAAFGDRRRYQSTASASHSTDSRSLNTIRLWGGRVLGVPLSSQRWGSAGHPRGATDGRRWSHNIATARQIRESPDSTRCRGFDLSRAALNERGLCALPNVTLFELPRGMASCRRSRFCRAYIDPGVLFQPVYLTGKLTDQALFGYVIGNSYTRRQAAPVNMRIVLLTPSQTCELHTTRSCIAISGA